MAVKKKGLGRGLRDIGLNELLSRMTNENSIAPNQEPASTVGSLKHLNISCLQPGKYQPRKDIADNTLEELAESIRSQGIIQPIVVRQLNPGQYEIVAGERRWRAASLAGLNEVPVIIRDIPDNAAIAMALIENIQRENLNAIEEATALQRLSQEFGLTHNEVAKIVGKSRSSISNLLRLLTLHPEVKRMVEQGMLEMGHARAIVGLDDDTQIKVAQQVALKEFSVRETELYIRRLINLADIPLPKVKNEELARVEKSLSKRIGARVAIRSKDEKKGKLIVYYRNPEQLAAVLNYLDGKSSS